MASSSSPTTCCANAAIDQIDQLLVSVLDEYGLDGEARVHAAIEVLSWLFTNVVFSRDFDHTAAPSQTEVIDNLCAALKTEAITALLSAPNPVH